MNSGKYLFSQLVEFLPKRVFDGIVKKYSGDKYVKTFTCWNQLLVMMYGQLSSCDSLREVICIIDAIKNKSYHLGFGSGDIKLSNVAYANANRDYRIFEEFAYYMINLAQSKRLDREFVLHGIISKKSNSMKRSINNKTPNKGGRPTKKLSEKRKYRITVKMATEEYYAMKLKAKNAGVSASEIVRMAIRDCHIRARLTTEQADYIRKLCGIANNLNQLTRKAHREGVRLHYGQCQHLLLSLENIIDHISL